MATLLSQELIDIIKQALVKEKLEIELRFGFFEEGPRGNFISGVEKDAFQRIDQFFAKNIKPVIEHSVDYYQGEIRKTLITPNNDKEPIREIWLRKRKSKPFDIKAYNIRLALAQEIPIEPIPEFQPNYQRNKYRHSYHLYKGMIKLDLTIISDVKTIYEVELELIHPLEGWPQRFETAAQLIYKLIHRTEQLYTKLEADNIIRMTNRILRSEKEGPYFDHELLVPARDLKLRDMVYGGLVGGDPYTVTHKADGERRLVCFFENGIWLLGAPRHLNRLTTVNPIPYNGTILEGEELSMEKRHLQKGAPVSKYWVLIFDCLALEGDNSIQAEAHNQRMVKAQIIVNLIRDLPITGERLLTLTTKSFYAFTSPTQFYQVMRQLFSEQEVLSYEQDGFMFTPDLGPYHPHSERIILYKRVLTRFPDVCKWKPKEKLTIDFEIRWGLISPEGHRTIRLYSGIRGGTELFQGTLINPFDPTWVDADNALTQTVENGTIVEYGWNYQQTRFIPVRIRTDKIRPNRMEIAQDVWDDINHPLEPETMMGYDLTLVYAYHNKIKKRLYQQVEGNTLLDIGSGRGGDVAKWKKFEKIVAVEPNPEHIIELKRRIELYGMKDRVLVLEAGGEETEKITEAVRSFLGGPAAVVSMMLSLSFFWPSNEKREALLRTIKTNLIPGGTFIFLTIDGDAVKQIFQPFYGGPSIPGNKLKLNKALFEYHPEQDELTLTIPGTIVETQREGLVYLGDLIQAGLNPIWIKRTETEKFLSREEIIFSKMYTAGIFKVNPDLPTITLPIYPRRTQQRAPLIKFTLPTIPKGMELSPRPASPRVPEGVLPLQLPSMLETKPSEMVLPSLPVEKPASPEMKGIGDDKVVPLELNDYKAQQVVRIAVIGDGSCFFHAYLKGYYVPYQNNSSYGYRVEWVAKLRRDLAYILGFKTIDDPTQQEIEIKKDVIAQTGGALEPFLIYDTANDGMFLRNYQLQLQGKQEFLEKKYGNVIDFSLKGIQEHLNSNHDVGMEIIPYITQFLGVDVIIVVGYVDRIEFYAETIKSDQKPRPIVVIMGNKIHFELIGIKGEDGLIQTNFGITDPFIQYLRGKKPRT